VQATRWNAKNSFGRVNFRLAGEVFYGEWKLNPLAAVGQIPC
jgi:hypothetical protein